jgi:methionyl-tRNA formyltransferase
MRVVILTSLRRDIASRCLPALCAAADVDVARVVLIEGVAPGRKGRLRKLKKVWKIGVLGALNGIRMRAWYSDSRAADIEAVAASHNVPLVIAPFMNSEETKQLIREADADLGLSLGNAYIAESVFSIPRHGMINIHSEILPDFQGAQGVIWPIHAGRAETGFTIHQIDRQIDTGDILYQERHPIAFGPTLRATVEQSAELIRQRIPFALADVCARYEDLKARAKPQGKGRSFTTPSIWQYLHMWKNHRALYARSRAMR